MTALVGIAAPKREADLNAMFQKLAYRGSKSSIYQDKTATVGILLPDHISTTPPSAHIFTANAGPGHFARASVSSSGLNLTRDLVGVVPMYYGYDAQGILTFASEVKALLPFTQEVFELQPGASLTDGQVFPAVRPPTPETMTSPPAEIAAELTRRLDQAVRLRAETAPQFGCLLSGGLDSSIVAALARPYAATMHTFAAGVAGAPDLEYARYAADFLKTEHHERSVTFGGMLAVLPDVIYHLESFDALLIRSSILHYLASQEAVGQVQALFSGEGADELFAGYDYLKALPGSQLRDELDDITARLHNTALQRVDRCIQAHGISGWVPMLDPVVVEFAGRIPVEYKLHQGVEKWILRQAAETLLPEEIVNRPKAKFWQGGGVGSLLSDHANQVISDHDFYAERRLPNGWTLNTKEELLYYRIFKETFGELENLDWVGRTKGSPVNYPSM
jgi:asparagine synthase (glutamine-hydrolysing)